MDTVAREEALEVAVLEQVVLSEVERVVEGMALIMEVQEVARGCGRATTCTLLPCTFRIGKCFSP